MTAPGTYRESLFKRIWQAKYSYLMVAPFTILFVLFTVLPVAIAIWFSFTNYDMLHNALFSGVENYIRMVSGRRCVPHRPEKHPDFCAGYRAGQLFYVLFLRLADQ